MAPQNTLIASNLSEIRERIARSAARAGRTAEDITLVAVSKTFPSEAIRSAYELGLRHFGENRVQEWESKRAAVGRSRRDVASDWSSSEQQSTPRSKFIQSRGFSGRRRSCPKTRRGRSIGNQTIKNPDRSTSGRRGNKKWRAGSGFASRWRRASLSCKISTYLA